MPKIISHPDARGIYQRKNTYWLRHSVKISSGKGAGKTVQVFTNLQIKTSDGLAKAIQKAKEIRGKAIEGKTERVAWSKAIANYLAEKQDGKLYRPKHLVGRPLRQFRKATAAKVASCLRVFGTWTEVMSPALVTKGHLEDYYELYRNRRSLTPVEIARLERHKREAERETKKKQPRSPKVPKKLVYVEE